LTYTTIVLEMRTTKARLALPVQIYFRSHRAAAKGVRDTSARIIMETLECDKRVHSNDYSWLRLTVT